jgi:hypothetical protein
MDQVSSTARLPLSAYQRLMSQPLFHGKTLSANVRLQISPNVQTKRRRKKPVPAASTIIKWNFNAVVSGHPTTITPRTDRPPRSLPTFWSESGLTLQGNGFNLDIAWDQYLPFLQITLWVEYGAGFIVIRQETPPGYTGQNPYDTGVLNWTGGGGQLQVWLQGQQ